MFKFLFFDQYLYNNDGSDPLIMVNEFAIYLKKFYPDSGIDNINNFIEKFIDTSKYTILINEMYNRITINNLDETYIYETFRNNNNNIILLSGWTGVPGHSIAIYIELQKNKFSE